MIGEVDDRWFWSDLKIQNLRSEQRMLRNGIVTIRIHDSTRNHEIPEMEKRISAIDNEIRELQHKAEISLAAGSPRQILRNYTHKLPGMNASIFIVCWKWYNGEFHISVEGATIGSILSNGGIRSLHNGHVTANGRIL